MMCFKIQTFLYFFLFYQYVICFKRNESVIIIGAGASGIAALSRLLDNGFEKVLVLEAENRIGGRVNSVFFKNGIIELGAEHSLGEEDNIVYDLVKQYNLLARDYVEKTVYHSVYKQLSKDFTENLYNLFDIPYSEDKISNVSLGEYILSRYNNTLRKLFKSQDQQRLALEGMDLVEKWVLWNDGPFSWFDLSAEMNYKLTGGFQELIFKENGFKTLFDVLLKKYPNNANTMHKKISLNRRVSKIDWSDPNSILVKCNNNFEMRADHVITTMSLGVLKNEHKAIFYPALPVKKSKAIEAFGIAGVIKMFLYFPKKWWSNSDSDFTFMWTPKDIKNSFKEFPEGPHNNNVSWVTNLWGLHQVQKNPNVLIAWFLGKFVPEIENCNERTLINGIMFALKKFVGYKYANISPPTELQMSHWYTNPNFRGSYSFETIKSRQLRVAQDELLAEPLTVFDKPSLLFAGEATHPYYYATVHGAVESGFREADRLINFYS